MHSANTVLLALSFAFIGVLFGFSIAYTMSPPCHIHAPSQQCTPCPVCTLPVCPQLATQLTPEPNTNWKHVFAVNRQELLQSTLKALPAAAPFRNKEPQALFMAHRAIDEGKQESFHSLARKCEELVVAVVGKKPCFALVENPSDIMPYHMFRFGKEENVDNNQTEWKLLPRVLQWEKKLPQWKLANEIVQKFLIPFFAALDDISMELKIILEEIHKDNDILIMAVNQGDLDLLLNFVLSARKHQLDISNLIVFAGDEVVVNILTKLSIKSYYHTGIGSFPVKAAGAYGDTIFKQMMWLKVAPLYLVAMHGYNVLFQDADVIWFLDPYNYLHNIPTDTAWQDDGARSERYSPLYANSGFYYLKNNPRTMLFLQNMLFSYDMIHIMRSHQEILTQVLIDHISRHALTFTLLPMEEFPSGQVYHHRKSLMESIVSGKHVPFMFHMCWTANRNEKLKYLKSMDFWYLPESCELEDILGKSGESEKFLNSCMTNALL